MNTKNLPVEVRTALVNSLPTTPTPVKNLLLALPADKFGELFEPSTGRGLTVALTQYANQTNKLFLWSNSLLGEFELQKKNVLDAFQWDEGFVLAFPKRLSEEERKFVGDVVAYRLVVARLDPETVQFTWENDWTLVVEASIHDSNRSDPDEVVFLELEEFLTVGSPVRQGRSNRAEKGTRLVNPPADWKFPGVSVVKF